MADNTFKKVGSSNNRMYGPQKIVACGYAPEEHASLLAFLKAQGFEGFPVVFVPKPEEGKTLKEIISSPHLSGYQSAPGDRKALILSGFTENELRRLLSAYRTEKTARPLMATLTPTSNTWTVQTLLTELGREAEAMKRLQRQKATQSPTNNP